GIHDKAAATQEEDKSGLSGQEVLRPLLDLSRLSDLDRRRSLGLGYLDQVTRTEDPRQATHFQQQALKLLSEARVAGLRDAVLDASLTRLHSDMGLDDVTLYAERALAHPDLAGQDRCVVLYLFAYGRLKAGRHQEAVAALREVTGLRRHPADWLLLADCERLRGNE